MESASVETNVRSWQALVAGTRGHQTRYLDQRSAQVPESIVRSCSVITFDFECAKSPREGRELLPEYPFIFVDRSFLDSEFDEGPDEGL